MLLHERKDAEKPGSVMVSLSPDGNLLWTMIFTNILPLSAETKEENPNCHNGGHDTLTWELTLFMWICCWYCFCFSKNCWCCCWMTSWANVLWGSGADWVRFRGLWRGNLWVPLMPGEILSFAANGDWGCKGTPPEKKVSMYTYTILLKKSQESTENRHKGYTGRKLGWMGWRQKCQSIEQAGIWPMTHPYSTLVCEG